MTFSKPIWNQNLSGLFVRVPLGIYLLYAGRLKLLDPNGFIDTVRQFKILPDHLATLYAVLLPYFEILTGGLLILGLWTSVCAILAALMLLSFIIAINFFPYPENPFLFNKDVLLLCAALSLLSSGAGAFSIDNFRQGG